VSYPESEQDAVEYLKQKGYPDAEKTAAHYWRNAQAGRATWQGLDYARVVQRVQRVQHAPEPNVQRDQWKHLYRWLGEQAEAARQEAAENESSVNLDANVGMDGMAEGFIAARRRMRRVDPSLPREDIDRS
jgi:hypothetical protein